MPYLWRSKQTIHTTNNGRDSLMNMPGWVLCVLSWYKPALKINFNIKRFSEPICFDCRKKRRNVKLRNNVPRRINGKCHKLNYEDKKWKQNINGYLLKMSHIYIQERKLKHGFVEAGMGWNLVKLNGGLNGDSIVTIQIIVPSTMWNVLMILPAL